MQNNCRFFSQYNYDWWRIWDKERKLNSLLHTFFCLLSSYIQLEVSSLAMDWMRICVLLLLVFITQSVAQDMRFFRMSVYKGSKFQCANTSCFPSNSFIVRDVFKCRTSCLNEMFCKAASFSQLTFQCDLFDQIPDSNHSLLNDITTITMTVVRGTRMPPGKHISNAYIWRVVNHTT